jgi:hypothetical protein
MPVAINYQQYNPVSEPYTVYNRQYIDIDYKGQVKAVRFYTDEEWSLIQPQQIKDKLGFSSGLIYLLIDADEAMFQQWLEQNAKYSKIFGWYIEGQVAVELPEGVDKVAVRWEEISYENELLPIPDIEIIVAKKRKQFQLENVRYSETDVGHKITDRVICVGAIPVQTRYGLSTVYNFMATDNQGYEWMTNSSQNIETGASYQLTGTIKSIMPSKVRLVRCSVK